jgi:hypothetical protein
MIHSPVLVDSSFTWIANTTTTTTLTAEFEENCISEYTEREIASKKLGKLSPYEIAIAILVELSLLSKGESVFERTVYGLLRNLPVSDGHYTLDIEAMVTQYIKLCWLYSDTEFAQASFNSLYRTWTDKESFDRNYNLTGKEAHLLADDTNLSQLLKAWIFFMSEHHNRFFYTYDPRCSDTDKAYYTVLGDSTKHKRSCGDFVDYLSATRPIFARLCMISPDKSEIHQVYATASAESKAFFEKRRTEREAKRLANLARRQKKTRVAPAPSPIVISKPAMTLSERRSRLDDVLRIYENAKNAVPTPRVAPVASVWKKVQPAKVETAPIQPAQVETAPIQPAQVETAPIQPTQVETAPIQPAQVETAPIQPTQVELEDDGFIEVKTKKVVAPVGFEKKVSKKAGRTYRLFKDE